MTWDNTLAVIQHLMPRSIDGLLTNCALSIESQVTMLGWTETGDSSYSQEGYTCQVLARATLARDMIPRAVDELTSSPEFNVSKIAGNLNVQHETQLLWSMRDTFEKQIQRLFAQNGSIRIVRG